MVIPIPVKSHTRMKGSEWIALAHRLHSSGGLAKPTGDVKFVQAGRHADKTAVASNYAGRQERWSVTYSDVVIYDNVMTLPILYQ